MGLTSGRVGHCAWSVACVLAVGLGLVTSPCRADLPPSAPPTVEPSAEAREQFNVGVSLLQDPDGANYEEAFKAFMRAYTATPSWKILGNLGLSALKIERFVDGIEAYERYLAQAADQLDPAELEQVKRDLNVMKATSGTLVLTVSGASGVTVEDTRTRSVGGPVVNLYPVPDSGTLTLRLASGHHTLRASAAGKSGALELDVKSGENVSQTLTLSAGQALAAAPSAEAAPGAAAPAPRSSGLRTAGLVIGGVGVAALIGGGVTGFLGLSAKSDLESRCPDKRCAYASPADKAAFESDRDSLETMGTLTTALLIGGGVLAAGGATLFVIGGSSSKEPEVATTPYIGPGVLGLSARGTF